MKLIDLNIGRILSFVKSTRLKVCMFLDQSLLLVFNSESDVDFLVRFKKDAIPLDKYGDNYFDLQFALEDLFNRKVDLVCDDAIKNQYFGEEVDSKKQLIYG